jgi:hypothetical protein
MSENPYAPPQTNVERRIDESDAPPDALRHIRNATIAACISGAITLLFSLLAIAGTSIMGYTPWELVDAALVAGLAFGIYKKSRACAIIILVYFVGSKIYLMIETGKPSGLLVAAIFVYYYVKGVQGTFQYHKWRKAQRTAS